MTFLSCPVTNFDLPKTILILLQLLPGFTQPSGMHFFWFSDTSHLQKPSKNFKIFQDFFQKPSKNLQNFPRAFGARETFKILQNYRFFKKCSEKKPSKNHNKNLQNSEKKTVCYRMREFCAIAALAIAPYFSKSTQSVSSAFSILA